MSCSTGGYRSWRFGQALQISDNARGGPDERRLDRRDGDSTGQANMPAPNCLRICLVAGGAGLTPLGATAVGERAVKAVTRTRPRNDARVRGCFPHRCEAFIARGPLTSTPFE